MMSKEMGKGKGKGKGMRMGKGSNHDDEECVDDIGKGSKMGKGSRMSGKGGGKGLKFVPEYEALLSPSPPTKKNAGKGGFDLASVKSSRLADHQNITNTTTTTLPAPDANYTNITEAVPTNDDDDEYRNETSDTNLERTHQFFVQ